ncbi:MAG: glycosyltransferase [Acidobacteria bacterium]|nr:glycosyltransferase [Acidobacteriota bacterium]
MALDSRRLNVVQICDHLGWPGSRMHGVKRLFAWMIPRFDPARFNVSLISLRSPDTSGDRLEDYGIDVSYLSRSKFDPRTLPALLQALDRRGADILHLHGYGATTFGRLAAARRGWPALLHEHANLTDTPWFQKVADRLLAPHTDLAIAVSRSTAEFVTRARLVPEARTRVVYLGAPVDDFAGGRTPEEVRSVRSGLGLPAEGPVVGTITRLMPAKGNEYLVEAARTVLDEVPDAHFCIVGEGELASDLEALARRLGVAGRVRFAGYTRDVAGALAAFDVVAFPSLWEGTPLTAFEALAAGRPIVATDADGLSDILHHDRDAIIVPKRNPGALAQALVALLRAPDRRAELAAAAAVTGAAYDIGVFVRKLERLYGLMDEIRRTTGRRAVAEADLGFLTALGHPS